MPTSTIILLTIIYVAVSTAYHAVKVYKYYKHFKEGLAKNEFVLEIWNQVKQTAIIRLALRKMLNPFNYFIYAMLFIIVSPFLWPGTLLSDLIKLTGYKSKLELETEEEELKIKLAKQERKQFLEQQASKIIKINH